MRFQKIRDDEDIYVAIGGPFPLCNTIVIFSDEIAVIDPGCRMENLRALLREFESDLKDIDVVFLSHIHPDHITHATRINRLSRCRIVANEITAPLFNDKERMKRFLGFHTAHPVRVHWERLVNSAMYGALDEGQIDDVVSDNERYTVGRYELRMMMTPGHLPDHMCIEFVNERFLFAADIDCTEFGPFYGHPNSSINQFKESIDRIIDSEYEFIISSHLWDPIVNNYKSALESYKKQFDIREDLIYMSIIDGADSVEKIIEMPIIYTNTSDIVYLQFEKWMIQHHIRSLEQKGLIISKRGKIRAR